MAAASGAGSANSSSSAASSSVGSKSLLKRAAWTNSALGNAFSVLGGPSWRHGVNNLIHGWTVGAARIEGLVGHAVFDKVKNRPIEIIQMNGR